MMADKILLVWLAASVVCIGGYADTAFSRNVRLDNRRVCDASTNIQTSLTLDQCARLCHSDSSSMSFVYNRNDGRCELLSRIHVDPEDSYSEPGNVEFWKRDGNCDVPTSIANGKVLYVDGLVEGSKAEFVCNDFHIPTTEAGLCDISGEWVGLDTPCQLPLLPTYSIPAEEKIHIGSCVIINATPTANTKFMFRLQEQTVMDINFLLSARFTKGNNMTLVRNTRINETWGVAEMDTPYWPFVVNQEFNLTICAEESMYRVHVDREEIFTYSYRRPLSEIRQVILLEDIALRNIRFVGSSGNPC